MTTRRKILIVLGAGALAPSVACAQPQKKWRIGFLGLRQIDFSDADDYYGPFTQGLRDLGYVEGRNVSIEWRSAEGKAERLAGLAAELVRSEVNVLVTVASSASLAAQRATNSIPIVMVNVGDPIGLGLVKTLARPGGNSTGLSNLTTELYAKRLAMLREMMPRILRIAFLLNPTSESSAPQLQNAQAAARKLGLTVQPYYAATTQEIATAFSEMARHKAQALVVQLGPFFLQNNTLIAELAVRYRIPSIGGHGGYTEAGGLMSYGNDNRENPRRAAVFVDKIFKGAKPGDLPIEQPTKFELVLNLKAARSLGLKVPNSILAQATKVIE